MYILSIHEPNGRKIDLTADATCSVGRTARAQFVVPNDPELSSLHFVVHCDGNCATLRDCQSTNGTFVNGKRVAAWSLQHGDEIRAGRTRFLWEILPTVAVHPAQTRKDASVRTQSGKQSLPIESIPPQQQVAAAGNSQPETSDDKSTARFCNTTGLPYGELFWQDASGRWKWTLLVKASWQYDAEGRVTPAPTPIPVWLADQLSDETGEVLHESDLVPFKPRADVLLIGHAYAERGRPTTDRDIRLSVGRLSSRLRVIGDRCWKFATRAQLVPKLTAPVPWTTMPLSYRRAFGGIDESAARYCEANPDGQGFIGDLTPQSVHNRALPNIEDPQQLIVSWESRPQPMGWGYYPRGAAPRVDALRRYVEAIQHPGTPQAATTSYVAFNAAHPLLQQHGYLRGGEIVEMIGVTPRGLERFALPQLFMRIRLSDNGASPPRAVLWRPDGIATSQLACDTLVLLPEQSMFTLVYRIVVDLGNLELADQITATIEQNQGS